MRISKSILVYLFIGSVIGQVFALSNHDEKYIVAAAMYLLICGYLIFLFLRGRPQVVFITLVVLFVIQLISAETHSFSYLFTIGLYYNLNFSIGGLSSTSTVLGLSASDFSPVPPGEPVTIGFNILAFVFLLLVIVKWKK